MSSSQYNFWLVSESILRVNFENATEKNSHAPRNCNQMIYFAPKNEMHARTNVQQKKEEKITTKDDTIKQRLTQLSARQIGIRVRMCSSSLVSQY